MKSLFVLLFSVAFVVGLPSAYSAEKPPKELVEGLSKTAFDGLLKVKNAQGETILKATDAKTLQHPLVSYDEREKAVARGYLSANAKWCGLDWQKDYFEPYIKSLQTEHKKNWTPYQYAYVEVVHGVAMGVASQDTKNKKCSADEKKRIAALAKK